MKVWNTVELRYKVANQLSTSHDIPSFLLFDGSTKGLPLSFLCERGESVAKESVRDTGETDTVDRAAVIDGKLTFISFSSRASGAESVTEITSTCDEVGFTGTLLDELSGYTSQLRYVLDHACRKDSLVAAEERYPCGRDQNDEKRESAFCERLCVLLLAKILSSPYRDIRYLDGSRGTGV